MYSGSCDETKRTRFFTSSKSKESNAANYNELERSDTHVRLYGPGKNKDESARLYRLIVRLRFQSEYRRTSLTGQ